jgi:hypothetical protein
MSGSKTKARKYWKPGWLYCGKTKRGEYISEKEAVQNGYLPAKRDPENDMAVNLRLTHTVKDRTVEHFRVNGSELLISFVDGSTMNVTIAECNSLPLQEGARIRQISEDETTLLFECEDESILDVTIVDPGNSVIVRDKRGQVEFLG